MPMYLGDGVQHTLGTDGRYGAYDGSGDDGDARGDGVGAYCGSAVAVLRAEIVSDRAGLPVHLLLPRGHQHGPLLRAGLRGRVWSSKPERVLLLSGDFWRADHSK